MDERGFHDLISGRRRGVAASLARGGLAAVAPLYGLAVRTRNLMYDTGLFRAHPAGCPVVSVGNLTTGGTGKTPICAAIARWFLARHIRPVFLSRGFRSDHSGFNDEARVLAHLCPEVPHVQQPDRVAGARLAVETHHAQVLILDDGFQHRRLQRDLDLVLIDALNPWGYGALLPRGLLREPRSSLRRAGGILITRSDLASAGELVALRDALNCFAPNVPVVETAFVWNGFIAPDGTECERLPLADGSHWQPAAPGARSAETRLLQTPAPRAALVCGIGHPEALVASLERQGIALVDQRLLSDHATYDADELARLDAWARKLNCDVVLTTLKDLVKIPRPSLGDKPLRAVRIAPHFPHGADRFDALLQPIADAVVDPVANGPTIRSS